MKVDDPVGPFADVFFEWHVGVGLVEQGDVWRVLVSKIVNTLICSNDNEEFGITVETGKVCSAHETLIFYLFKYQSR